MVLTEENKKISSHKLAKKILGKVIMDAEWELDKQDSSCNTKKLTDKERIEICNHIAKLRHRIFRHFKLIANG